MEGQGEQPKKNRICQIVLKHGQGWVDIPIGDDFNFQAFLVSIRSAGYYLAAQLNNYVPHENILGIVIREVDDDSAKVLPFKPTVAVDNTPVAS